MGLKQNIFYSSLLTTANYLFQFITFPYVTRVLGPDGIGIINFTQSFLNCFVLFCSLGIINLGIREISKCKSDDERNICFSKIFKLNILITAVVSGVYLSLIFIIPKLLEYFEFFLVGLLQLIFNALLIEWLFKGLEKFKYITIRSVLIRFVYVAAVFIFVKKPSDTLLYFILTCATIIVNGIINGSYARKYVKLVKINIKEAAKEFLKPMFLLGSQAIIAFFYVSFNTLFLGFVHSEDEVGFYSVGTKIIIIILTLFGSIATVLLPRISSLVASKEFVKVNEILTGSIEVLFYIAIPLMAILSIFAQPIVYIIAGESYYPAIKIVAISSPLILVLGLSQIAFVQIMIPSKMDKQVSLSCLWGAVVSICLNFLLVKKFGGMASMFIWLIAETIVLIRAWIYIKGTVDIKIDFKNIFKIILFYIPPVLISILINLSINNIYVALTTASFFFIIWAHFGLIYIVKNDPYIRSFRKIRLKFSLRKNHINETSIK